ncbi:MAG: hypothetical protein WC299_02315 [Kiritimatiellia bacterium]
MKKKWQNVLLLITAVIAAGISIPLYFVAMIGVGMSPGNPHVQVYEACLLLAPPIVCVASSVLFLRAQWPSIMWRWLLTAPLLVLSGAESIWILIIISKG